MTTLIRPPASLHGVRDVQSSPRPVTGAPRQRRFRARSTIIVASDGSSGSDGAIRMALAKFDPTDTALEVVTVVASSHGEGAVAMMLCARAPATAKTVQAQQRARRTAGMQAASGKRDASIVANSREAR